MLVNRSALPDVTVPRSRQSVRTRSPGAGGPTPDASPGGALEARLSMQFPIQQPEGRVGSKGRAEHQAAGWASAVGPPAALESWAGRSARGQEGCRLCWDLQGSRQN